MKIVALDMPERGTWAYALACRGLGFVPRYYGSSSEHQLGVVTSHDYYSVPDDFGAKPETMTVEPPKPGDDLTMKNVTRLGCAHDDVLTSRCDECGRKPNWDDPVEPPIPDGVLRYLADDRSSYGSSPLAPFARELLALRKWARGAIAWLEAATGSMRDLELPPTNVPDTVAAGRRLLP